MIYQKHFFYNGPMFKLLNDYIIIFIDTTVFTNYGELPECYKHLSYCDDITTVDESIEKQSKDINNILETLKDKFKNIIFVGHHPIFTVKNKKDGDIKDLKIGLKNFMLGMMDKTKNPIIYLCADTHNYQKGKIIFPEKPDRFIQQYIVGSGGAHFDNISKEDNFDIEGNIYIIKEKIQDYCILHVDTLTNDFTFYNNRIIYKKYI